MSVSSRRSFLKALAVGCSVAATRAVLTPLAEAAGPAVIALPESGAPASCYIPDNAAALAYRQQYPLSCEMASFKIVLLHYGLANVTEELLQDLLGVNENPNTGFRGDYRASRTHGLRNYGAHAPAVAALVRRFPRPGMFNPIFLSSLDQAKVAISRNWLVMAWIPVALEPSLREPVRLSNGQWVSLVPGEHVIVLHGYDGANFYLYDPHGSPRLAGYAPATALARGMGLFDRPALAIQPLF